MSLQLHIDGGNKMPKYLQVVNAITDAIRRGLLKQGEKIFSINELSDAYLLSRDTVERAYSILRSQGIILAVHGKGFYVRKVDVDAPLKVLLLFNKISDYKKQIYTAFIDRLGPNALVDLKIHHQNIDILGKLVDSSLHDYHYFVIMPHFPDDMEEAVRIIKKIPADQLIILDKKIPHCELACGAVYQDYENDIIIALEDGLGLLSKYQKLVLVHSPGNVREIRNGFRTFCLQQQFSYEIIGEFNKETDVKKGEAYVVIEETDLANLIKRCRAKGLVPGEDVGIISYNETPLKEILLEGITVISTDHQRMGETAAQLILDNRRDTIKNPFALIRRNSL